jgi:hypothetical protein
MVCDINGIAYYTVMRYETVNKNDYGLMSRGKDQRFKSHDKTGLVKDPRH